MEYLRKPLDRMAMRLYTAAKEVEGDEKNIIICPFTITSIMAMLYYACEGTSHNRQMENILHFQDMFEGRSEARAVMLAFREAYHQLTKASKEMKESEYEDGPTSARSFHLVFATKIFVQEDADLHEEFLDKIQRNLKIDIGKLDFNNGFDERKKEIQEWLQEKSQHRFAPVELQGMIDEEYHGPRAFVGSAAHYRAGWETPFNRSLTYWGTFRADDGRTKEVEFMTMKNTFPMTIDEHVGVKMVEIPYYHNTASLVVTIPIKKGQKLSQMLAKFPPDFFTQLHMRRRMKLVNLHLPKLFYKSTFDMRELLVKAGVRDIFNDQAALTQMTSESVFRISEGFLKFAMQADEDGSFATENFWKESGPPPPRKGSEGKPGGFLSSFRRSSQRDESKESPPVEDFICNGSFLVACRHNKSALFVFSGCVMCP